MFVIIYFVVERIEVAFILNRIYLIGWHQPLPIPGIVYKAYLKSHSSSLVFDIILPKLSIPSFADIMYCICRSFKSILF